MTSSGTTRGVHEDRMDAPVRQDASDLIISYLEQLGVEYVFGIPGGAIEPLYNALARSQRRGTVRPIVARHESGAAFMADGYARETGKLGVCCATTGPGATNMITGVASAYQDRIPLLVITAQTALNTFGKGAFQESSCTAINTVGMYEHCTRFNSLVSHADQLETKLTSAIMTAFHHPRGPVHLSIPLDILRTPLPARTRGTKLNALLDNAGPANHNVPEALYTTIEKARRIVILVGEGCDESIGVLYELAAQLHAVVIATPQAKGITNPYNPTFRGICGVSGHREAKALLASPTIDLIIAIGTGMDQQVTPGGDSTNIKSKKFVHIDAVAENLMRSPNADLHILGNIRGISETLLRYFKSPPSGTSAKKPNLALWPHRHGPSVIQFERRKILRRARSRRAKENRGSVTTLESERRLHDRRTTELQMPMLSRYFKMDNETKYLSNATPIKPQRLMYDLSRLFPPNTRFLADIGNSFFWAMHYLHPYNRRVAGQRSATESVFRASMGFGSMGWAIGAAVGTALANPKVAVVCIVGDGSMLMSGQEITVAVTEQLPVIYVVLNDSALGTIKHGQRLSGAEPIGFELPAIDFAAFARLLGANTHTVNSPADFAKIDIGTASNSRGPTLIDVHIDAEETPPIYDRVDMLTGMP